MPTLAIAVDSVANGSVTFESSSVGASSPIPEIISRVLAPVSTAAQAYFWTRVWQEAEAEADADYRAGRFRTFQNPRDAIRHLLSTDED